MGCNSWNPLTCLAQGVQKVVNNSLTSAMKDFAEELKSGAQSFFNSLSNFWTTISFPDFNDAGGGYQYLRHIVDQITPYIAVFAMIIGGFRIVKALNIYLTGDIIMGILRIILTTSGAIFVIPLLGSAADHLTDYIINVSPHNIQFDLFGNSALGGTTDVIVDIVLNGLLLIASLSLLIVMIIRHGVILIIAATLPWSAAASICGYKETFNKQLSWLMAWIIYKPVAALLLSFSIFQVNSKDNIIDSLSGIAMLFLCVVLMPVLMRLITPAASNTGDYWFGHHLSNAGVGSARATIHAASNLTSKAADSKMDRISKM